MNYTIDRAVNRDDLTRSLLQAAGSHRTSFGIDFLDDALYGMLPNDLVLIGAKSGRGKSALAVNIAKHNAMLGKRVVFIALEAEPNEVEMRLRYQLEAGLYFKDDTRNKNLIVNYRNWRFGKLETDFKGYALQAKELFAQKFKSLVTVYRQESFNFEDLQAVLERTKNSADLFILDHLHYMDLESGNDQHYQISKLMKQMRSMNLFYNKPFVVVAHLRKNIESLLPSTEDFMGSSDIGKNATTCIMVTPRPDAFDPLNQTQETIFSIPKSRTGGLGGLCGMMQFSLRHQQYLPFYKLATVGSKSDNVKELQETQYPDWAAKFPRAKDSK